MPGLDAQRDRKPSAAALRAAMTAAIAWFVFPGVVLLIAATVGLLAERAARTALPDALLAPAGACLCAVAALGRP